MASNSTTLTSSYNGGKFTLSITATASNPRLVDNNPVSDVTITATLKQKTGAFSGNVNNAGTLYVDWEDEFGYPAWENMKSTKVATLNNNYSASASASWTFTVQHNGDGNLTGYARARWVKGGNNYQPASGNVQVTLTFSHIDVNDYIYYYGNGGYNVPETQTKEHDATIYISEQIPLKATELSSPYVVSFNGNGGEVDAISKISYLSTGSNFVIWNTEEDGSGTNYSPGAPYSTNNTLNLYAQWSNSVTRQAIILPSGSRDGYILKGFGTSAGSTSCVSNPYTPSNDITLYAIWEVRKDKCKYKYNNSWIPAPIVKVKIEDEWYVVPMNNIKIN